MKRITLVLCILLSVTAWADEALAYQVMMWIHTNVEYVSSPAVIKTPAQTLLTGGDCADMSALMLWLLAEHGIEADMLVLNLDQFVAHHAVVKYRGKIYDPVAGKVFAGAFPLPHRVAFAMEFNNLLVDWGR
jgi:transglutaminase-like putative cysteine protease